MTPINVAIVGDANLSWVENFWNKFYPKWDDPANDILFPTGVSVRLVSYIKSHPEHIVFGVRKLSADGWMTNVSVFVNASYQIKEGWNVLDIHKRLLDMCLEASQLPNGKNIFAYVPFLIWHHNSWGVGSDPALNI